MANRNGGMPMERNSRGLREAAFLAVFCLAGAGVSAATPPVRRPAPCRESIPALYERVSPAVVSITAASVDPYDTQNRIERQAGSGVIVDSSGLVLTNSHVVFGHPVIAVTLDDGTTLPAQIVGADPLFDIALIRIPPPASGKLPTVKLGSSERLVTGDEVYAIGNPFGLEQTLTRGIVSAVNRILPGVSWFVREPLIQTDAAINRGSSGGPLIDRCGAVVGITTAILDDAQGIGFAIPVSLAKKVMEQIIETGTVTRGWFGVEVADITPELAESLGLRGTQGAIIGAIERGSPAERSGMRLGDVIVAVNGRSVPNSTATLNAIAGVTPGMSVPVKVLRRNQETTLDIMVGKRKPRPRQDD